MARPTRILVLGSGAREHALCRALERSDAVDLIVVAPGSGWSRLPGDGRVIARDCDIVDPAAVVALAAEVRAELVIVGPEAPLAAGVVDALVAEGIATFGPSKSAAELESSKAFLKRFATRHGIPTADYAIVTSYEEAEAEIRRRGAPIVVKADGLCAGKGVVVASTVEEALEAAHTMLVEKKLGEAGATVILESCLVGKELSLHAISDGERFVLLPGARDHKRIFDGDRGPNTGGMGVICPIEVSASLLTRIRDTIIAPSIDGMRADGAPFRGVLFAGLMLTEEGPMLLEHNVRFGDPECEALMALFEGDLASALHGAASSALDASSLPFATEAACVVILAAEGYPEKPVLGAVIEGIAAAERVPGVVVNQAGTRYEEGRLVVSGGRVLAVTARGVDAATAHARAYEAADLISFQGKQLRRDIGR